MVATSSLCLVLLLGGLPPGAGAEPTDPAPAPALPEAFVLSLFSDVYVINFPVVTGSAPWDDADLSDVYIDGDAVKLYTNVTFAGIELTDPGSPSTLDASGFETFHIDVWTPDASSLWVKLVDFGADGIPGGGDDSEDEQVFDAGSSPALVTGAWIALDIPFDALPALTSRAHLGQLILAVQPFGSATLYVDNVYFFRTPVIPAVGSWAVAALIALIAAAGAIASSRVVPTGTRD